ncbi:MAG TPA: protein-methionine-sulfoxide reductase heme-binding subunit MsrQ [Levilinea sp.]|nr:protein-methionine-sulfoxide reductase heme-binding subunit MsrQ [Levilinea sp.]
MKKSHFTPLQIAIHVGALLPLAWLVKDYLAGNLTVNPIQAATQRTGDYALLLLLLSLAVTPLITLTGYSPLQKVRRPLGLYAFLYAAIHLYLFAGVDYGFNLEFLLADLAQKRFIFVGLAALLLLIPLAFTSYRYWQKRLGKTWKLLHRLVYLAATLVVIHVAWAVKGDLFTLQGDIWKPLLASIVLAILFLVRIPGIRRRVVNLRMKARARRTSPAPEPQVKSYERKPDPGD